MLTKAAVFSDHMVLQRHRPIPVWGGAEPGETVAVSLNGAAVSGTAGSDGQWRVLLPAQEAGGAYTLEIRGDSGQLALHDVMIGDVWFAGGQSNMEMALCDCRNGKQAAETSRCPNLRFYNVPKRAVPDEELSRMESESSWQVCTPETSGSMSAAAYFFARRVMENQRIPIGIIDCYWGGTSVSCWMSRAQLEQSRAGQRYIDHYAALVGDKTDAQYQREMEDYNADWEAWNTRVQARRAKDPEATWEVLNRECGVCPWPQPAGNQSPFRPAGLYECMVRRVAPYALRGFLYYQGEEDEARHADYGIMLSALIDQWRSDWGDWELPFLLVQLPMYCSREEHEAHLDSKHWAALRDQQWKISRTVRNTGIAVLADCGEFDNIHPLDKQTVGYRLALQALAKVYGEPVAADAPRLRAVEKDGSRMILRFTDTAGGPAAKNGRPEGFELAGADGVYHPAHAEIQMDSVVVWSDGIAVPETVRYAWTNYGAAGLYGASGLPAVPFRTDCQPVL